LIQQYFFQRLIAKKTDSFTFLEENILTEVLNLTFEKKEKNKVNLFNQYQNEGVAERAIRFIETNLFHELTLSNIASCSNASVPTLLRHFKKEISKTPYVYIKERRMFEALNLLKSGQHTVTDIAILVGYQNPGAFSEAFRSIYKKPPSTYMKKFDPLV
jgi:AraC-like DNA-binding protein